MLHAGLQCTECCHHDACSHHPRGSCRETVTVLQQYAGLQDCSRGHTHLWVSVGLIRMRTRVEEDEAVLLQIIIR